MTNKEKILGKKMRYYFESAEVLYVVGKWNKAEINLRRSLNIANNLDTPHLIAECKLALAELLLEKGLFLKAQKLLITASNIYEQENDLQGIMKAAKCFGTLFWKEGKIELAKKYFQRSYEEAAEENLEEDAAIAMGNLSAIYLEEETPEKAMRCAEKVLEYAEIHEDKSKMSSAYSNLGAAYTLGNDPAIAMEYYLKALSIEMETGNKKKIGTLYSNIGTIYLENHNPSLSERYFEMALKIAREIGDQNNIFAILCNIGFLEWKQKNYENAIHDFKDALNIAETLDDKKGMAIAAGNLSAICSQLGRDEATEYIQKYLKYASEANVNMTNLAGAGKKMFMK